MTIGARIWILRYSAEDRRHRAAARQAYLRDAAWCLLLAVLTAWGRT